MLDLFDGLSPTTAATAPVGLLGLVTAARAGGAAALARKKGNTLDQLIARLVDGGAGGPRRRPQVFVTARLAARHRKAHCGVPVCGGRAIGRRRPKLPPASRCSLSSDYVRSSSAMLENSIANFSFAADSI
jgi:hypothetical protein